MRSFIYFLVITLLCFSCKKDNVKTEKTVEIYLLKSHQTMAGKCQIDASASVLEDAAIITNKDILQYSNSEYQFKLTNIALKNL